VATCLPGAELTEDSAAKIQGQGRHPDGPGPDAVRRHADITERDEAAKRVVVHAAAPMRRGAARRHIVTATLTRGPRHQGRRGPDLQLSGAAAQYGRGMISDVSSVLMRDFATNMQDRIERIERGESVEQIAAASASPAKGFTLGLRPP